jgi:N-acetylneuraminate synthase
VDIGERQAGRLAASSVFRCEASRAAIREAIEKALKTDCSGTVNPYGDGEAAGHILSVLKSVKYPRLLLAKAFSESDPTRERTLVIAEAGVNHNGSVERAMKLIDAAADAGADVVKFQTFRAELVVTGSAPKAEYQNRTTPVKESQLDMIRALQLSEASHRRMIAHAKKRGIEFLSTPFDEPSVDFLVKGLKLRRLKVPSGEITNAPLLLKVASTGLPLIISTGMATTDEVRRALGVVAFGYLRPNVRPSREAFEAAYFSLEGRMVLSERVTLLQCTTEYPSPYDEANILVMDAYREIFGLRAGLSDHTPGIQVAIAAVARGAAVIEKHMTLSRSLPGPDHKASLEPHEFKSLVQATRRTQSALGSGIKSLSASEAKNVPIARKSLVTLRAVSAGEKFTRYSVTAKRPGTGIDPFCFWEVVGKRAARNIAPDEVIASEAIHGFSER